MNAAAENHTPPRAVEPAEAGPHVGNNGPHVGNNGPHVGGTGADGGESVVEAGFSRLEACSSIGVIGSRCGRVRRM